MEHCINFRRHTCRILVTALFFAAALPAYAQIGNITDANLTDAERRDTTLLWLDTFLTESNLLRKEDVAKIREAVAQMPPSQLREWLDQTRQLRTYVESEKWQQTKEWLREFLRVQAIYSDEELQQIRDDIVRADADQLLGILKRIQAKHDSLVWMHQAAQRNRVVEVAERDAYLAQQAMAAQAARAETPSNLPLFGTGTAGGAAARPSQGSQINGPLIDSRAMARAAVWAEMWGPGFIIGF